LKNYWSVDVENGLAWAIWTSEALVMVKRKARSQTGNLTLDHWKSGIDLTLMHAGGSGHTVGKLSTTATTLLQTLSRSEVWAKSYSPAKLREFKPWQFWDSSLGVSGQKVIRVWVPRRGTKNIIWGKVVASPESGPWWVLWVQGCLWLVLALKAF
jgi:hypothetical protein